MYYALLMENIFNESLFEYPLLNAIWKNKTLYGPIKLDSLYDSNYAFCIVDQADLKIRRIKGERWSYKGQTKPKPTFNPIYMRISEFQDPDADNSNEDIFKFRFRDKFKREKSEEVERFLKE